MIFDDEKTHRWNVVVYGLPAAPSGERYTFWFLTKEGMVRGADVLLDQQSAALFTLEMPKGATGIHGGALTMEPMAADYRSPQGKELARLEM